MSNADQVWASATSQASSAAPLPKPELSDRERLLALDSAQLGTWVWNLSTRRIEWDAQCGRLFGHAEIRGCSFKEFFEYLHPADREATLNAIRHVEETHSEYDIIHRVVWPDESIHWLRCKGTVSHEDHNRVSGMTVEVSWLKRAEDIFRTNERLIATASLASALAHEINNPLEIMCNAFYLLKAHELPTAVEYPLQVALDAYERITNITRQMLALHARPIVPQEFTLQQCLHEVVNGFQQQASHRRVELDFDCDDSIVNGSISDVQRMASILIENALESSNEGCRIRVRAGCCHEWTPPHRTGFRLVVADNGCGIPHELRNKLFHPFTTGKGAKRSGLGLWACRAIVDRYGGTIRFKSSSRAPMQGTTFSVFFTSLPSTRSSGDQSNDGVFPIAR